MKTEHIMRTSSGKPLTTLIPEVDYNYTIDGIFAGFHADEGDFQVRLYIIIDDEDINDEKRTDVV